MAPDSCAAPSEPRITARRVVVADAAATFVSYDETLSAAVQRRTLPSSRILLIASGAESIRHKSAVIPTPALVGLHDRPLLTAHSGVQQGVAVWMTPWQAYSMLGVPLDQFANGVASIGASLGPEYARCRELGTFDGARLLTALEHLIARRIACGPRPATPVVRAWRVLAARRGSVSIGNLAREVGYSRRQLERVFRTQVGVTPKTAARIFRFEHVLRLLSGTRLGAVGIAQAARFSDQSHLIREVQSMAGCAPGELATSCRRSPAGGDAFVQDGEPRSP